MCLNVFQVTLFRSVGVKLDLKLLQFTPVVPVAYTKITWLLGTHILSISC